MMVGSVIENDEGLLHVVTRIKNDYEIIEVEPLEEFISKSTMVKFNGEYRTIREIIEMECNDYISKVGVSE
jgi:hypothetical protein